MESNDYGKSVLIRSLFYKFFERCGYQGIQFVVQIILARMLDPTDYGLLTLLTVFINISQVFVQSGLNTALIQRRDVTEKDYSTVFYTSLIISILLYLILFFSAPSISIFYKMPELQGVLRVLALILIPGAFNSIQNAKVAKEMRFKQLMICTWISVVLSGLIGIVMAYLDMGVWALVAQQLTNQVSICLLLLIVVKWRPQPIFEINRLKLFFGFGWKLLCSALLDRIYGELQSLVIGKRYDASTLGFYNRGKQFPELIVNNLNGSIQSVMLPALSKFQDDRIRMKSMMRRAIITSSFVIFPFLVGLAVCAEPLISIILTDKWLPCIPYMRIYCFCFAFYPIHTANLQAINAQGRSDIFLKLEIIKKLYGLIVLLVTVFCFKTPIAIAMGGAVSTVISCFVNASPNKKLLNYSYIEQMKDLLPQMICSAIMGIVVYCVKYFEMSNFSTLIIQVMVGAIIYVTLLEVFHIECYLYVKKMIIDRLKKQNSL